MLLENILDSKAMEELTTRLNNDHIDVGRFMDLVGKELASADENKITNKHRWLEAVIERLLKENKESLKRKNRVVTCIQFNLNLDHKGYTKELYEVYLLELIATHMVNEFLIEPDEISTTLNKITEYIETQNLPKTYHSVIELFLKSKLVKEKNDIPINELTTKAKELTNEWLEMMKEFRDNNTSECKNPWE